MQRDCGSNLWLYFLVFDRLRTPVTEEADLITFYNWFCKRATAEADFLGSCRKYILSLISHVSRWRSTKIFLILSLRISTKYDDKGGIPLSRKFYIVYALLFDQFYVLK